jgi:hypothetical protein
MANADLPFLRRDAARGNLELGSDLTPQDIKGAALG